MDVPLLSVCSTTYNHVNFIKQAIDGFLVQKVDFAWEIIIADDFSTDGTREILLEYKNKYPDLIKLILQEKNVGAAQNCIDLITTPKSKYIALCDGDDYWTDPLKLQKQVDFLEANPDFAICFHNAAVINEYYPEKNRLNSDDLTPEVSTLDNLLKGINYIATASVVIKTNLIQNLPDWFASLPFGDYGLYLIAAQHGKIRYLNEIMSVYRIHQGGVYSNLCNTPKGMTRIHQQTYEFWKIINKSATISQSRLRQATLRSIKNVVYSAANSKQIKVFLIYHYLLLIHSHGEDYRQVPKKILRLCRSAIRELRDHLVHI
ncbi:MULTISPECIES: glycosyltransferase [unclassified Dolichospermum]|uniref:glycosyltransferase n=1 Tax=unclassified Dolichospermum TaxID=2622029 RepID=UPI001445C467|nr:MULTISPECIES: glycosyltransferase [unclassified Dolichospermum]MTJ15651.1 glycosyltransferase [Dolichospermum sp. UHCC 0299]MTJ41580.1 glycosyltransferase [Dolichospermum sp. UHCC 0406]